MNNEFKTQVDLDLQLERTDNYDIETKKINLRWNLELELRQYGVKSVIITVPEQFLRLDINVWGDDTDTYEEMKLTIKDVEIVRDTDSLIPHTLGYFNKKWRLVF
jgi:hypothetical protein